MKIIPGDSERNEDKLMVTFTVVFRILNASYGPYDIENIIYMIKTLSYGPFYMAHIIWAMYNDSCQLIHMLFTV